MNKKFLLAWGLVFVVWFLGNYVIHELLLKPDYSLMGALFRSPEDQQAHFPVMILAHLMFCAALVWVYARGAESRPWPRQGLRFGIALALLAIVPSYLIYFAVQPVPQAVVVKQVIFSGILAVIAGMLAAWMYRGTPAPA